MPVHLIKLVFKRSVQAIVQLAKKDLYHTNIKPSNWICFRHSSKDAESQSESLYDLKLMDISCISGDLRVDASRYTREYFLTAQDMEALDQGDQSLAFKDKEQLLTNVFL